MLRRTFGILAASLSIFAGVHCSAPAEDATATGGAESDFTGTLDVKPIATFGTGNHGSGDNDIDEPDGIIFNRNGHLLMTDAANHRVHVWDWKNDKRLGQFGDATIFTGEVVDLAENPLTGQVIVTDEKSHLAYAFDPPTGDEAGEKKFTGYVNTDPRMFNTEKVIKVGGITFDSKCRIYTVDARQNLVRRYDAKGTPDPTFKFAELGSTTYLNGCEGIAIDEKRGNIYVSSEFESTIRVFDLETGAYKKQTIGRHSTPETGALGDSVFPAAIEGLWILDDYLLASNEADTGGPGSMMIFDLRDESLFNTGPSDWKRLEEEKKSVPYKGSVGSFASPDSVSAWTDKDGESYVAIADQAHRKVPVYRWSDIVKAGKFARAEEKPIDDKAPVDEKKPEEKQPSP